MDRLLVALAMALMTLLTSVIAGALYAAVMVVASFAMGAFKGRRR